VFADVLNDEFLLEAAERTRRYLERVAERWGEPEPHRFDEDIDGGPLAYFFEDDDRGDGLVADISADDIWEVIEELGRASVELQNERNQETARICIPSIPILAILQSQLARAFELRPHAHSRLDDIFDDEAAENVDEELRGMVVMGVLGPYEVARPKYLGDPRWLWMEVVKRWYKHKNKVVFGGFPDCQVDIADDARIVLVGDWGSGLKRAQRVSYEIERDLGKRSPRWPAATRYSSGRCLFHRRQERV
jgi:hypothetical protein